MTKSRKIVAVVGAGSCDETVAHLAFEVGALLAAKDLVLVTGGRGGVMEAASRGAASRGGTVIGILPGPDDQDANDYVGLRIVTGLGEARNIIIARTANGMIALKGEYGTLSEISFALKFGKPVISLDSWEIEGCIKASSPEDAVERLVSALSSPLV